LRKYLVIITVLFITCAIFYSMPIHALEPLPLARVPVAFSTIQEAIDNLAQAGTVEVESGTYYDYVRAYKPLSLIATGEITVIDGKYRNYTDSAWQIYVANADNVTISGFTFLTTYGERGATGIRVENCANVTIANCTFEDTCGSGIELVGVSNALVFNNTIDSFDVSITIWNSNNVSFTYNTLRDAGEQFQMYNSRNIVFHHNNNFNDEAYYPRVSNTTCTWDDGHGRGNYWSDYTVRYPDATNLGAVWDTPYQIDPDDADGREHFDNYPLIEDPALPVVPQPSGDYGLGGGGRKYVC